MTETTFTTREQYFVWRAAWKTSYKEKSLALRKLKGEIAEALRAGEGAGGKQSYLLTLKEQTTDMLSELLSAKVRAGLFREHSNLTGAALETEVENRTKIILERRSAKSKAANEAVKKMLAERRLRRKDESRDRAVA